MRIIPLSMNSKITCRILFLLFSILVISCNSENNGITITGRWQVTKAEVDGYSITSQYTLPEASWIYFNSDGTFMGGRELSEFTGKWKLLSRSRLYLTTPNPQWNNTTWKYQMVDSVLYLRGTKSSNNFTRKLWFEPSTDEIPPFRLYSEHDKRLTGTWNLLRIKRNSELVSLNRDDPAILNAQITFLESGIYKSNLPGEDELAGYGVWNLDEYDLKLSLFPFNTPDNKKWDYSFAGDLLRLSSIEHPGKAPMKWEWIWEKSSNQIRKEL